MPLSDIQVRLRELGRIRTGVTIEGEKDGRRFRRPEKLSTFRLTSPSRALIEAAAAIYKGTIVPWESPAGAQWELVTQVDVLPIVIPWGENLSQWYELWAAGGCQRRCDGRTEQLSDGPCLCPSDPAERRELAGKNTPEACKPTTRLNVVLPDLPDLGVWRLESHGYYAAVELAGAANFLAMASRSGMNIPARLRLEQREKKVPGRPVNRYAVPVIEFAMRITDLLEAGAGPMMLGDPGPSGPQLAPGSLVPETGKRTRGPKVERPALGPAPAVPDGSGFGWQQPSPPVESPALPTTPTPIGAGDPGALLENGEHDGAPDTVAGWPVIDGAPPAAAPKPARAPRARRTPPPPPPSMTADQLRNLIGAMSEGEKVRARVVFERRFPNVSALSEVDEDALGRYWHEFNTPGAAGPV